MKQPTPPPSAAAPDPAAPDSTAPDSTAPDPAAQRPAPPAYRTPDPHPSGERPPRLRREALPTHVAMIMDGNGRWAVESGRPRWYGHRVGITTALDVVDGALEIGIPYLSLYAFSTENWNRSTAEVYAVMGLLRRELRTSLDRFHAQGVRLRWAGRRGRIWRSLRVLLEEAEERTRDNDRLTVCLCLNYGGRAELLDAAAGLAADLAAGRVAPDRLREADLGRHLYVPEVPDVDLLVRTGGEQRISNFLLWQAAYAELVFDPTPWPEVDRRHLWQAVLDYTLRQRRFGAVPPPTAPRPVDALPTGAPGP